MNRQEWAIKFYSSYFSGLNPGDNGECMVRCPFHDDVVSSMSLNLNKGVFYCHACRAGGDEYEFYRRITGYPGPFDVMRAEITQKYGPRPPEASGSGNGSETTETSSIPEEEVTRPHRTLFNIPERLQWLQDKRGLKRETLDRFQIGFDLRSQRYTIPIRDMDGRCVNIRKYSPESHGTSKMISFKAGYGSARLFPVANLENDIVLLTEGEMDCILANQLGYNAVTTTGGANTWKSHWNPLFEGKTVYICYDIDAAGKMGAEAIAKALYKIAAGIKVIKLPITDPPDGDITDYFVSLGHAREDFDALIEATPWYVPARITVPVNGQEMGVPTYVHLSEASQAEYIDQPVVMDVIVSGKDTAPFGYPKRMAVTCTPGHKRCALCGVTVNGPNYEVQDHDRDILSLIDCTDAQQKVAVKSMLGIPRNCAEHSIEVLEQGNVEEVILQPELDFTDQERPYTTRVAYVLGHGVQANCGYRMTGVTVTDPRKQYVTHIIYESTPSQDNIATFRMTPEWYERLKIFRPAEGQSVAEKFEDIANDLTHNVTHIYGRNDLVIAIDLVYHSALSFKFQGQMVQRGWVEGLVIGDTRSGKSETAQTMMTHYRLGEFVTGENTSFAGLIGGMQQNQKRWFVSWGKIPINDRRLVVLDEASGLSVDNIENMSGVRSSGIAEIIKIHQEKTYARTRLLWISNTRTGDSLKQYDYGVNAVKELMGKNEDIARLEFALTCASEEVPMQVINQQIRNRPQIPHVYTSELCKQLILWIWSRNIDDFVFEPAAVDLILQKAQTMAEEYTSEIPLVEGANQRIKLARLAIAVAGRMFSSDETGEKVVVRPEHVEFAHQFLEMLYKKPSLGYWEVSRQRKDQERLAAEAEGEVVEYLKINRAIANLLLQYETFRNEDVEYMCDFDRPSVRAHLRFLVKNGMIQKRGNGYTKRPILIKILRERKWLDD